MHTFTIVLAIVKLFPTNKKPYFQRQFVNDFAWPEWWDWDLEFTPHLRKRMKDRGFNQAELREMFKNANGLQPDNVEGRWVVSTTYLDAPWEIIVEPDSSIKQLVIITAYRLD